MDILQRTLPVLQIEVLSIMVVLEIELMSTFEVSIFNHDKRYTVTGRRDRTMYAL